MDDELDALWTKGPEVDLDTRNLLAPTVENRTLASAVMNEIMELIFIVPAGSDVEGLFQLDKIFCKLYRSKKEQLSKYPVFTGWKKRLSSSEIYGSDLMLDAVKRSFKQPYIDKNGFVDRFVKDFIYEFGSNWLDKHYIWPDGQKHEFYSPYCSIIQSSSAGKTRFMFEVGKKCCLFYICFRPYGLEHGYPFRSSIVDYLEKRLIGKSNVGMQSVFRSFFLACLQVLNEMFHAKHSQSDENVYLKLQNCFLEESYEKSCENVITGSWFWDQVEVHMKHHKSKGLGQNEIVMKLKNLKNVAGKPVCFAFDEARHLLKLVTKCDTSDALRECHIALATSDFGFNKMFITGIFADTDPKIDISSSPNSKPGPILPSIRVYVEIRSDVYKPYWAIPGWKSDKECNEMSNDEIFSNINMLPSNVAESQNVDEDLFSNMDMEKVTLIPNESFYEYFCDTKNTKIPEEAISYALWVYSFGRPMWRGFVRHLPFTNPVSVWQLKQLAKVKLALCRDIDAKGMSNTQLLAILNARMCLSIPGCATVSSDLVANHMATCYYISDKRDFLLTGYPVEPLITAAAIEWMAEIPYRTQISCLVQNIAKGDVSKELRGEILCRFLFTIGFDLARTEYLKSLDKSWNVTVKDLVPVPLETFLKVMFGSGILNSLLNSCNNNPLRIQDMHSLLNGKIRIGQWIKAAGEMSWNLAETYFRFGIAIMSEDGSKMIPVRISAGVYSWLIIQNDINGNHGISDVSSMHLLGIDPVHPYIIIRLQFHQSNCFDLNYKDVICENSPAKFIVSVSGLSHETYPLLELMSQSKEYNVLENLKLLRDGSFRIESKNVDSNPLQHYWHEIGWHNIVGNI